MPEISQETNRSHSRVLYCAGRQCLSTAAGCLLGYGSCSILNRYRRHRFDCHSCLSRMETHARHGKMVTKGVGT